jgi:hypothetical protein
MMGKEVAADYYKIPNQYLLGRLSETTKIIIFNMSIIVYSNFYLLQNTIHTLLA